MEPLKLELTIDPKLPPQVEGAISFETGGEPFLHVYGPGRPGPLACFYEDLASGAPMPLVFATKRVNGPHTVVAAALFLDRELVLQPATPGFVYAVDLAYRMGDGMLAHVDPALAQFLRGLAAFFPKSLSKAEQGKRLATGVQWVREILTKGVFPNIGPTPRNVRVLDVGSNGFVIASSAKVDPEAWETLFRWGNLRGVLLGEETQGLRPVLAARKTKTVGFDLERLVPILDELEQLAGGEPGWNLDGNYLASPRDGSTILTSHLVEVFLRG